MLSLKKGYRSAANPFGPRDPGNNGASSPCGPDDDCTYIDAPYHSRWGNSRKSPRPRDGYSALKNSIRASEKLRVAIQDGEFVVLRRTSFAPKCEYHGYKTDWNGLPDEAQQALKDNKLVNHKGKIL